MAAGSGRLAAVAVFFDLAGLGECHVPHLSLLIWDSGGVVVLALYWHCFGLVLCGDLQWTLYFFVRKFD
jgi:hypothetical protein